MAAGSLRDSVRKQEKAAAAPFVRANSTLRTAILLCVPAVAGCAASSYAGVPLKLGEADLLVQAIARQAQSGDKAAQLELGILYENGTGVPRDLCQASRLYRKAAASSRGGEVWTYLSAAPGASGRMIKAGTVKAAVGLAAAKLRLSALEGRLPEKGCDAAAVPGASPVSKAAKVDSPIAQSGLRDCSECPPLTKIPLAERYGFSHATTYEITWRQYRAAVVEKSCTPPLAAPEQ